jgi:hypothetical protein
MESSEAQQKTCLHKQLTKEYVPIFINSTMIIVVISKNPHGSPAKQIQNQLHIKILSFVACNKIPNLSFVTDS